MKKGLAFTICELQLVHLFSRPRDETQLRADVKGEIMALRQVLGSKSEEDVLPTAACNRAWAALTKSTVDAFATM